MNLSGSRGLEAKEPCQVWYNFCLPGPVAQLVEQRIENPRVTGSIPVQATNIQGVACENVLRFSIART